MGSIYVLDEGSARLYAYRADGEPFATIGPVLPGGITLRSPRDVAVDGMARVYIADPRQGSFVVLQ